MGEMIERLTQTVASEAHVEYGCLINPGEIVRAVLAAMREPTEAMMIEGASQAGDLNPSYGTASAVWLNMIGRCPSGDAEMTTRRGLFGLFAGAAALPLAPKPVSAPPSITNHLRAVEEGTYQRYSGYERLNIVGIDRAASPYWKTTK